MKKNKKNFLEECDDSYIKEQEIYADGLVELAAGDKSEFEKLEENVKNLIAVSQQLLDENKLLKAENERLKKLINKELK